MTDVVQERIKSLEQRLLTDPQSPLFARLASFYLQVGRASDALRLCDDGLALYPFYSTAHLVKGKALIELGMVAEAKHEFEVVHELLPTNKTLARLASSIGVDSSGELTAAPATEIAQEPEPTPTAALVEEAVAEEPQAVVDVREPEPSVMEEPVVPTDVAAIPEPPAEQPETVAPVETVTPEEDSFGFQAPPAVEEVPVPPSGYEMPGFGVEEPPQPAVSDTEFGAPSETQSVESAEVGEPQAADKDYGFGVSEEAVTAEPVAEEVPSSPETTQPTPSVGTEDAFGVPIETAAAPVVVEPTPVEELPTPSIPPASEPVIAEAPPKKEDQTPDWFEAFTQLQQPAAESAVAAPDTPAEEENPFAMFGAEEAPAAAEGEPYEEFAARTRMELFGTEDTMTLDQYLGSSSLPEPPAAKDQIGELTEKLKSSPRITPPVINYSEKAPRPATEGDAPAGSGFVTPTLAEIYVKQGWLDDAIKAYRALVVNKPAEKEKFEQRIAEIEEMKKKQ